MLKGWSHSDRKNSRQPVFLLTFYHLHSLLRLCHLLDEVICSYAPVPHLCPLSGPWPFTSGCLHCSTAYYAHLLFFTSWSPALFFYYRFISFWMLTFFWPAIFMGVLPVGTQLTGSEYASFSMHQLNLYLHMFKRHRLHSVHATKHFLSLIHADTRPVAGLYALKEHRLKILGLLIYSPLTLDASCWVRILAQNRTFSLQVLKLQVSELNLRSRILTLKHQCGQLLSSFSRAENGNHKVYLWKCKDTLFFHLWWDIYTGVRNKFFSPQCSSHCLKRDPGAYTLHLRVISFGILYVFVFECDKECVFVDA